MLIAAFRVRFPEFRTADDSFVQAVLDAAAKELHPTELGYAYNEAHGLVTAHKLALSPFGQSARMVNEKGETTYAKLFDDLIGRSVAGVGVI